MPLISVVSPVYRAEECVDELCRRLKAVLSAISEDYEIILVDDRSPDNSWQRIKNQADSDHRVRGIRLTRNFGQHYAITAGMDIAEGEWVVVMDCDLQDPPEKIPELYEEAMRGNQVVAVSFEERAETIGRQIISIIFWKIFSWLAGSHFDPRIGNFRIMSKHVVKNFRKYREQLRFLGGIVSLMGFKTSTLSMKRESRFAGKTAYTFSKLVGLSIDMIIAYSDRPLKLSIFIGLFMSTTAFIFGIAIIILELMNVISVTGWTSMIVTILMIGGFIIANLGLLGYYLGRTFEEAKCRPLYIIDDTTDKHK